MELQRALICFGATLVMLSSAEVGYLKSHSTSRDHRTGDRDKRQVARFPYSRVSDTDKTRIVDIHNTYRSQEGASNMLKMQWNETLAQIAQGWSDTCVWKHGWPSGWRTMVTWSWVGQNLYTTTGRDDPGPGLKSWYEEKEDYDFNTQRCTPGRMCGHYTQMVWHNSDHIGCGATRCQNLRREDGRTVFRNAYYLVCNYGPGGNYRGQPLYTKGWPCSQCPADQDYCDNGLCSGTPTTRTDTIYTVTVMFLLYYVTGSNYIW